MSSGEADGIGEPSAGLAVAGVRGLGLAAVTLPTRHKNPGCTAGRPQDGPWSVVAYLNEGFDFLTSAVTRHRLRVGSEWIGLPVVQGLESPQIY